MAQTLKERIALDQIVRKSQGDDYYHSKSKDNSIELGAWSFIACAVLLVISVAIEVVKRW